MRFNILRYVIFFSLESLMAQDQSCFFPLRWESTGDQWWYASPIDWAAANGHYELVRELVLLDANLLIKLTSLRRIRRLETVWDDDAGAGGARFAGVAECRAAVARGLFRECDGRGRRNSLIRAGYGGWLLYTAASAGDVAFARQLLDRNPLLVFGEGEYGITDIFYAAARGKNPELFRLLLDSAVSPRCSAADHGSGGGGGGGGGDSDFRWEVANRAAHSAARGGSVEVLRELLEKCRKDAPEFRDVRGCTLLHAASGRGQTEVVKYLVASFDMINARDNQGNTALHVASFRGHLSVVEALITASPSLFPLKNNAGDTFLHTAVAGFRTPGFRRLDRQMELMKQLICGNVIDLKEIINIKNHEGRTIFHMAVIDNLHPNLIELIMSIRSIDLNVRDNDGMTPLDLLRQHPRSASSEILIKQLISAGGISNFRNQIAKSAIASQLRMQGSGNSPGTSFKISDAEIIFYTGVVERMETSGRPSSCSSVTNRSELAHLSANGEGHKVSEIGESSVNKAANRLKILLRWPHRKETKIGAPKKSGDNDSLDSLKRFSQNTDKNTPTPLRQRFSKPTSLLNNKRTLAVRNSMPSSPSTKKKYAAGLMHGVIEAMPHLVNSPQASSNTFSRASMASPPPIKSKGVCLDRETTGDVPSCSNSAVDSNNMMDGASNESGFMNNNRLKKRYFCFGSRGLAVEDSSTGQRFVRTFKRSLLSVA